MVFRIKRIECSALAASMIAVLLYAGVTLAQMPGDGLVEHDTPAVTEDAVPSVGEEEAETEEAKEARPLSLLDRTEQQIVGGVLPESTLKTLRASLARQRAAAFEVIESGSVIVRSLEAELSALGPVPDDGSTEPAAIAEERAQLREALAVARTPIIDARQNFERSEVLIHEVDRILRERGFNSLLQRLPTPLNPLNWNTSVNELTTLVIAQSMALSEALGDREERVPLPILIGLFLLGLIVTYLVHPYAVKKATQFLERGHTGVLKAGTLTTIHIIRFVLPIVGGLIIASPFAIVGMEISSPTTTQIALAVPVVIAFSFWIGHVAFSPNYPQAAIVRRRDELARRGLWVTHSLGWAIALVSAINLLQLTGILSPTLESLLLSLAVVWAAACFFGLAQIIGTTNAEEATTAEMPTYQRAAQAGAFAIRLIAIIAAVSVAIGYAGIARHAVTSLALTLALLVILVAIHRLGMGIPARVLKHDLSASEKGMTALIPVVLACILGIVAIPLLAMTWGVRQTDIGELWMLILTGFDVGGIRLSLMSLIMLIGVFAIGVFVTHWVQIAVQTSVMPRTNADAGVRAAVVTFVGYLGVFLSALFAAGAAGFNLSNLAIVAGALSVGIGFGLQAIVANFLSGIILLIERPIKEGDWVEVSGYSGLVQKISVRSTRLQTFDRHDVIIPNSDLIAGTVKNMTLGTRLGRVIVPVSVAYGTDTQKVKALLLEMAVDHPLVLSYPEPVVLFRSLGESSLDFDMRFFINDVFDTLGVQSDMLFTITERFTQEGISIPFPQRDVHITMDEALRDQLRGDKE
ncbi:DUF3772 domain-containing protein [Martelella radicis]|uniref:Small-conductance mechanosensitive channel n=1 Tax=Martelella radicis TaxID=1397476 RepID=A0A7W6KG81_9HYPH|nr:DUF3772 domain-containing protein [Martelella radicis]MBB4120666.1 small-conductance mechanosensitive channel [Martelella radicis]